MKVRRSSKQKRKFSGKTGRHTHKLQLVEDAHTQQIICLEVGPGSQHDFDLYKSSKLNIHPAIKQKVDKGYLGIVKRHANTDIPFKRTKLHPLTKAQRRYNRQLARQRVPIEHTNRRLKVFKLLQQPYRNHSRFKLRATLIASFCNANLL